MNFLFLHVFTKKVEMFVKLGSRPEGFTKMMILSDFNFLTSKKFFFSMLNEKKSFSSTILKTVYQLMALMDA